MYGRCAPLHLFELYRYWNGCYLVRCDQVKHGHGPDTDSRLIEPVHVKWHAN